MNRTDNTEAFELFGCYIAYKLKKLSTKALRRQAYNNLTADNQWEEPELENYVKHVMNKTKDATY